MRKIILFLTCTLLSLSIHADEGETIYGFWSGHAQYKAMVGGNPLPDAHSVVVLTINIDPRGKVVGESQENGCKLLGIAAPSALGKSILDLNVTLKNCETNSLNRTYSGKLNYMPSNGVANLHLYTSAIALDKSDKPTPSSFSIDSTMNR